ncbi:MAG: endonuclease III [Clostridia bacterium]|nr:endonuclease III [Clostridia bacterium]
MDKKEIAKQAEAVLENLYPDAVCSLEAEDPFHLLVAVRLSAQCTDARVNLVTPALFAKYPTVQDFANADVKDVENLVHSCGFYRQKASDIVGMAQIIINKHNGKVPDTMEALTALPGVGRKTANLIMGDVYGQPSYVCDTHMIRIANRLGLVNTKDPYKVELALRELLTPETSGDFCHRAVLFGRDVCDARKPKCESCPMRTFCAFSESTK